MSMTRKDFILIAEALNDCRPVQYKEGGCPDHPQETDGYKCYSHIVVHMKIRLMNENSNFQSSKSLEACLD